MMGAFPALDIRPVQTADPMTTLAGLTQLRAAQTENLLRQQQIQQSQAQVADIQAQAQQRQRAIASQARLNAVMADPANQKAFGDGDYSAIWGAGADSATAAAAVKAIDEHRASINSLSQEKAKMYHSALGDITDALVSTDPTDPNAASQVKQQLQNIAAVSPEHAKIAQGIQQTLDANPGDFPGAYNSAIKLANLTAPMLQKRAEMKEQAGKAALPEAQAAEATAKAGQATAETVHQNLLNDLLQHPERGLAAIDQIAPPGTSYNTALKASYSAAQTPEARQQVLDKGLEQAGELDPRKRQAKISDALTTARHMAPIEEQKAVNTQKALAAASPDAFGGIINPAARNEVQKDWSTLYGTAATALNQSQQLLDTIKAEQGGNKAAASAITVDQARSLIANSRAMGPVMHQISAGSGNLLDKVEGKLRGVAGTDSLPPDVVKDIASLATIQQQAALRQYDSGLVPLQARGADVSKLPRPAMAQSAPQWNPPAGAKIQHNPQTGKERYSTDGGKTWVVQP